MNPSISASDSLRQVRFGILLSLLTILFGFGMGGVFGAAEEMLKNDLKTRAKAAPLETYKSDEAKMAATIDKAWAYYKRAHLHGGAIGTASLLCAILLAAMSKPAPFTKSLAAVAMGVGGLGYSIYWLVAGYRAPALGSTSAAKDSLEWLAVPTAGLVMMSLVAVIALAIREWMFRVPAAESKSRAQA